MKYCVEVSLLKYALLCGCAPENYRQKKIDDMFNFLTSPEGRGCNPGNIVVFPNGISEIILENLLNETFNKASEEDGCEVFLYILARTKSDLNACLSGSAVPGVEVVRLGEDEIRKEVISYYENLGSRMELTFQVQYDWNGELISEESLFERL